MPIKAEEECFHSSVASANHWKLNLVSKMATCVEIDKIRDEFLCEYSHFKRSSFTNTAFQFETEM